MRARTRPHTPTLLQIRCLSQRAPPITAVPTPCYHRYNAFRPVLLLQTTRAPPNLDLAAEVGLVGGVRLNVSPKLRLRLVSRAPSVLQLSLRWQHDWRVLGTGNMSGGCWVRAACAAVAVWQYVGGCW
eukprot:119400-Chlamydomonas_euryale.AAC.1